MANTLGPGATPASPVAVGDFTVAGVATRITTIAPTDADWGATPPPNGTIVFEGDGILWARIGGVWKSCVLY